ncbi:MAG: hypothetical protein WBA46_14425 [Thermomicrobiales bacterium]
MDSIDTTNLGDLGAVIAYLGILFGAAAAYGKIVGPHQTELTETIIEALSVPKRYKRVVNLAVGVTTAGALFAVAAYATGQWVLLVPGVTAGFLSSVEAGKVYDATKAIAGKADNS